MLKPFLFSAVVALGIAPAHASVVSAVGDGAVSGSSAGLNLKSGSSESADVQAFDESTGVAIDDNVVFADFVVGTNLSVGESFKGVDRTRGGFAVSAGVYDSHFLLFDPTKATGGINATFTFSSDIVAIIVSNAGTAKLLNLSDSLFGTASSFTKASSRRAEAHDGFALTASNQLSLVNWAVGKPYTDEVRVLTVSPTVVPVPASLPLLLVALGGMAVLRRRQKAI